MTDATTKRAERRKVLVDSVVRAEFPHAGQWIGYRLSAEERETRMAKAREEACAEFLAHCRDHRSLDVISLEVERVYQDQCSACGGEWETMDGDNGTTCCANCGAEVNDHA